MPSAYSAGPEKPIHVLRAFRRSIYNMTLLAVVDAQLKCQAAASEEAPKAAAGNENRRKVRRNVCNFKKQFRMALNIRSMPCFCHTNND